MIPRMTDYMFYLLNHAKNYNDYATAIKYLNCPGLNCLFASKSGDVAIWHQGEFPAKWKGQGDFIMPGTDSTYIWRGMIPQEENPHMKNPARGLSAVLTSCRQTQLIHIIWTAKQAHCTGVTLLIVISTACMILLLTT